ncbi:MAG: hypothetical protein L6455_07615 [Kiritimatiellae bacterium]|nr:hypothetical protein [Verrucomicrobiota bacterium]MCG2679818.1 hypothetical protein [Kiritimatiellia bacterium]
MPLIQAKLLGRSNVGLISDFLIRAENKMAPFAGLDKLIDHPRVCFRVTKMKIG